MKNNWKFLWIKIIIIIAGVSLLLYFFFEGLKFEILGGALGTLLAVVGSDFLSSLLLLREDKNKISHRKFTYDESYYRRSVKIGGGETSVWYDAVEYEGDPKYEIEDSPEKRFTLDPIVQANFSAIMQAHRASFIANPLMIRLDDYKKEENGVVRLFTSRTAYYNDLVTNRAMDYRFNGEMSVREIYENERYLTPIGKSKMSNHIGFGALVFYGNSMLLARRGGNATLSKNKFTETLAFGFSEGELLKAHDAFDASPHAPAERFPVLTTEDLFSGVLLVRLADMLNLPLPFIRLLYGEGKIRIHTLGFGQLVYTGGKPQFYFAIVVDESVDLGAINNKKKIRAGKKGIDYNKGLVFADAMTLTKNEGYTLKLRLHGSAKTLKGEAQKSFFINYWHLRVRPKIEGVPEWIYEN